MLEYVKVNALMLATRMNEMSERKTNSLYFSFIHEKMNPSEYFCCGFVFSLENQNRTQTQPKLRFSWNMHVKNSRDTSSFKPQAISCNLTHACVCVHTSSYDRNHNNQNVIQNVWSDSWCWQKSQQQQQQQQCDGLKTQIFCDALFISSAERNSVVHRTDNEQSQHQTVNK